MKKINVLLISIFFILTLTTKAFSVDVDGCTVERVGPYPAIANSDLNRGKVVVFLSHPTKWDGQWYFFLTPDIEKEGLATFLTAMALEKTVLVRVGTSAAAPLENGGIISVVYANNW